LSRCLTAFCSRDPCLFNRVHDGRGTYPSKEN